MFRQHDTQSNKTKEGDEKFVFEVKHAASFSNGIRFYSNVIPVLGVECYVDNNDQIKTKIAPYVPFFEFMGTALKDDKINQKKIFKKLLIFDIILCLSSLFIFKKFITTLSIFYWCCFVSFDFVFMITAFYSFSFKKGIKAKPLARFHAAEHMAVNAYHNLGRVPTLDEIRHSSRFSDACGSRQKLRSITLFTAISILMLTLCDTYPFWYFISAILLLPIIHFCQKLGLLKYLQFMITAKPTDLELKCALEGIKLFHENEKMILNCQNNPEAMNTLEEFWKANLDKEDINIINIFVSESSLEALPEELSEGNN